MLFNYNNNLCVVMNITIKGTGVDKILYREWNYHCVTTQWFSTESEPNLYSRYKPLTRIPDVKSHWLQNCDKILSRFKPRVTPPGCLSETYPVDRSHVLFSPLCRFCWFPINFLFLIIINSHTNRHDTLVK